jgi:hypothetical protein
MPGTLVRHRSSTENEAFRVGFHARDVETEVVRVRATTDGEKEIAVLNAKRTGIAVEAHGNSSPSLSAATHLAFRRTSILQLQGSPNRIRHVPVLAAISRSAISTTVTRAPKRR